MAVSHPQRREDRMKAEQATELDVSDLRRRAADLEQYEEHVAFCSDGPDCIVFPEGRPPEIPPTAVLALLDRVEAVEVHEVRAELLTEAYEALSVVTSERDAATAALARADRALELRAKLIDQQAAALALAQAEGDRLRGALRAAVPYIKDAGTWRGEMRDHADHLLCQIVELLAAPQQPTERSQA
jgi:hypothetical protein